MHYVRAKNEYEAKLLATRKFNSGEMCVTEIGLVTKKPLWKCVKVGDNVEVFKVE